MSVSRVLVCLFVFIVAVNASAALPTRTWVSREGDDSLPCGYTSPCRTLAVAYGKTEAGGMISVIDSGPYGQLTISKSITIDGGGNYASILFASGSGINVNFQANDGLGNKVVIRGVSFFSSYGGGYGVFVTGAVPTNVHVIDSNFTRSHAAVGMFPNAAGSTLSVENVEASNMDLGGFFISGPAGTPLKLSMNNVRVSQGAFYSPWGGVRLYGNTNGTISNSSFRNCYHGIVIENPSVHLNVIRTVLAENYGSGLHHNAASIVTLLDGCSIFGNAVGVSNSGGTVIGFSNNAIGNNVQDEVG